jgi:hypothetical protein
MTSTVRSLAPQTPIIEVVHAGDVSVTDIQHVATQALDLMTATGDHLVLTDWTDATSIPGNIAIMSFGEAMDRATLPDGFRHAHVWPTDDSARLSLDMWKTVENLHHHQARAFGDRESAIAWLTE